MTFLQPVVVKDFLLRTVTPHKGTIVPLLAVKAHRGRSSIASLILYLGTT